MSFSTAKGSGKYTYRTNVSLQFLFIGCNHIEFSLIEENRDNDGVLCFDDIIWVIALIYQH